MLKHFALNIAAAGVVFAWGFATGHMFATLLPSISKELRA